MHCNELGKRPYDQRRFSAFLEGTMNLTRCVEIETRGETEPFVS